MERSIHTEPDFKHGLAGYRKGCSCPVCREANTKRSSNGRAKRRGTDTQGAAGAIERTVRRELAASTSATPPWVETLRELAIKTARAIDNVPEDKPHLLSPLEGRLTDLLDRLRSAAPLPVGSLPPAAEDPDESEGFVNGLRKFSPA